MTTRRSFLRSLLSVAAVAATGGVTSQVLTKSLAPIEELPLYVTGALTPNVWHHVVVQRMASAPEFKLYLNGERVSDIEGLNIKESITTGGVDIVLKGTAIATVGNDRLEEMVLGDGDFTLEWWAKPTAPLPTNVLDGEILAYEDNVTSKG